MARVADPTLVAELRRRFSDVQDLRWNDAVHRWELISLSAAMKPVSQFWGWYHDPVSGVRIEPDPVTGLVPFRDLVAAHDQQALLANLEQGFRFKRGGDGQTWRQFLSTRLAWNAEAKRNRLKKRSETFAELIQECTIKRPWKKFHEHRPGKGRVILS